jgi:hypothetical protein
VVAKSQVLVVVSHHEGDLGVRRLWVAFIASDSYQLVVIFDDEREAIDVIHLSEMADLFV